MIDIKELYIVNYCHPNCKPLQNIMRLPKKQAFEKAGELARKNPETNAFYRFADFENYYPRRLKADSIIYRLFIELGGKPKEKHPLSFALQNSRYLDNWFGNGIITRIPLKDIPDEYISFTYGDSSAMIEKTGNVKLITKQMLLDDILSFDGTIEEYLREAEKNYCYIEVQLWNDDVINAYIE